MSEVSLQRSLVKLSASVETMECQHIHVHWTHALAITVSLVLDYRGTSLMKKYPYPQDHNRALGIVRLQGPREVLFLMSEVPLYSTFMTVKARFWPWLSAEILQNLSSCFFIARFPPGYRSLVPPGRCGNPPHLHMNTGVPRSQETAPPPKDYHKALGIVLL